MKSTGRSCRIRWTDYGVPHNRLGMTDPMPLSVFVVRDEQRGAFVFQNYYLQPSIL